VTLRLLSYNIRYGGLGRESLISSVIRETKADLVLLQEATQPRVVAALSAQTGLGVWGARDGHSLAFLSRGEVKAQAWHRPIGARHALLEVVLPGRRGESSEGDEQRFYGLHLSAIHSAWTERRRSRELRALLREIGPKQSGFHAVTGDFNTLAPGELLEHRRLPPRLRPLVWLGGRIRWETIQIMLDAGYIDGYRALHPDDRGYTFPTWDPHVRLDYCFMHAPTSTRLADCRVIEGEAVRRASDHFPLLSVIEA
jgi:exodeoxyribonuclease-3